MNGKDREAKPGGPEVPDIDIPDLGRTEDQIIAEDPAKVLFGGDFYDLRPLKMFESREWRKVFFEEIATLGGEFNKEFAPRRGILAFLRPQKTQVDLLVRGLRVGILQFPEKVADLFFRYAKDLPRDEIEKKATDREMVNAFLVVWGLAFPFFDLLRLAVHTAKTEFLPSDRPTN